MLQVGAQPISVEFIPLSGNYTHAIKTVTITVLAADVPSSRLRFNGFFQPVHNLPYVNSVSAGRAIAVKFSVEGGWARRYFSRALRRRCRLCVSASSRTKNVGQTSDEESSSLQVRGTQLHVHLEDRSSMGRHLPEADRDPGGW